MMSKGFGPRVIPFENKDIYLPRPSFFFFPPRGSFHKESSSSYFFPQACGQFYEGRG